MAQQPNTKQPKIRQPYTKHLPTALYRTAQVQDLDRLAIQAHGMSGFLLMSRAAAATFAAIQQSIAVGQDKILTVFCGMGNNGGDGYVIASLAMQAGWAVRVISVGNVTSLKGDALTAYQQAVAAGIPMQPWSVDLGETVNRGVIVDALLGIGLKGRVRETFSEVIAFINTRECPVCAVDIPSGLCGDTGAVLGAAVNADMTVTYIGVKQGLLTGKGPERCGDIFFAGLGVPEVVYQQVSEDGSRVVRGDVGVALGKRNRCAHKGQFGHVLVIGGDHGMGGAVMMASEAAGYSGAGRVSVLTRGAHIAPLLARYPECMVVDADKHVTAIDELLQRATVVVIGPGIGRGAWAVGLLTQVLDSDIPVVVDADGLRFLASATGRAYRQRGNWVLTPHPGEASGLLTCSVSEIEENRFASVQSICQQFGAVSVLKGAGTLVSSPTALNGISLRLADVGNPGMAVGGMGDVLSGVIGGLIAQGCPLEEAAAVGVWLHGKAADCAVKESGERGLRATDLFPYIRRLVNGVQTVCRHR